MVRNDRDPTQRRHRDFLIWPEAQGHRPRYVMPMGTPKGGGQLDSNSAPSGEGLGTALSDVAELKLIRRAGTTFQRLLLDGRRSGLDDDERHRGRSRPRPSART